MNPPSPAIAMIYTGDTPNNQISRADTMGIHTLYRLILADLASVKVGAAISATTAGRMPLKMLSTASYSLNCWKNTNLSMNMALSCSPKRTAAIRAIISTMNTSMTFATSTVWCSGLKFPIFQDICQVAEKTPFLK
mgnify:CR=1 FL=1